MSNEKIVVVDVNALVDYPASVESGKDLLKRYGVVKLKGAIEHVQQSDIELGPETLLHQAMMHVFKVGGYSERSIQKNLDIAKDTLEKKWQPVLAPGVINLLNIVIDSRRPVALLSDEGKLTKKISLQLDKHKLRFDQADYYPNLQEIGEEWGSLKDVVMISRNLLEHVLPVLMKRSKGFLVMTEGFTKKEIIKSTQLSRIPSGSLDQSSEWLRKVINRKNRKGAK